MKKNEFKNRVKAVVSNPSDFMMYASAVSMLLYTLGYFIRAIKK